MDQYNFVVTLIGAAVIFVGLFSAVIINRLWLTVPLLAVSIGILIGPRVFGLVDPFAWPELSRIVEETARLTLGISLMEVALRLPRDFIFKQWRSLAVVLGMVMPLMWIVTGLLSWALLALPFWSALLLGACLTPTDPVVASSIVTGRAAEHLIPRRIRHFLSAESAANDGLGYFMVMLPILMMKHSPAEAFSDWIVRVLFWEIIAAVLLGIFIGWAAGRALEWAEKKGYIEKRFFLGFTIAVSLITLGGVRLLQSDGILAVFVAGVAINRTFGGEERAPEEKVQETVNLFLVLPVFMLLGALLPWEAWIRLGWPALVLAAAILLFRRLPAMFILRGIMSILRRTEDVLFTGWFGPIAVAALYYISLVQRRLHMREIWDYGTLIIFVSVVIHGLTALPLSQWYHRALDGK